LAEDHIYVYALEGCDIKPVSGIRFRKQSCLSVKIFNRNDFMNGRVSEDGY
jgi:hypothetical protein